MTPNYRWNKANLDVACLALHGDMCGNAPHCESLGCGSGFKPDDYVLVAKFRYLQEAIDYCAEGAQRGVHMRLISTIAGDSDPFVRDYEPNKQTKVDEVRR